MSCIIALSAEPKPQSVADKHGRELLKHLISDTGMFPKLEHIHMAGVWKTGQVVYGYNSS